jgi:hypothetical protein
MKEIPGPSGGGHLEAFHTRCVLSRGKHANVACWPIVFSNSGCGCRKPYRLAVDRESGDAAQ